MRGGNGNVRTWEEREKRTSKEEKMEKETYVLLLLKVTLPPVPKAPTTNT